MISDRDYGIGPMRDSGLEWVAHIPEHWGTPPLGANFDVQLGKMLNQEAAATGEQFLYLRNVNVQWDHLEVDDMAAMHFDAADRIRYALQDGDLLVCEGGEVGRAAIWHGELADCYYQKALHRVRPRGDDNSRFLMYALWAAASCGVFENEGNTSTFVHLTAEKLRAHRFPWPPLSERRAISDYLDVETARVDALVSARKRQAGLLDARIETERESLFQALRERYGVVALKRLSDRVEQGWSPECDAVPAEAGEWGVLKTSAVSSGSFDRTENKRLPVTIEPDPRWIIRDGDLLVCAALAHPRPWVRRRLRRWSRPTCCSRTCSTAFACSTRTRRSSRLPFDLGTVAGNSKRRSGPTLA